MTTHKDARVPQQRVRQELEQRNPWYVGDQFAWAEKPGIHRIYENRPPGSP